MTDHEIKVTMTLTNEEEFRETLAGLEEDVRRVREEVQALAEELERLPELDDGQAYERVRQGDREVAFLGNTEIRQEWTRKDE